MPERGDGDEGGAGLVGKRREATVDKLSQTLGKGERIAGFHCVGSGAGELEREERVAVAHIVDPTECRPRERVPEALVEQALKRAEAERSDLDAVRALAEGANEIETRGVSVAADCEQQPYRFMPEAPRRELENKRRGGIEPLNIVNREEKTRPARELSQRREECRRDGGSPLSRAFGLGAKQRHLECAPLRRRQFVRDLVECTLEDITQRGEGELRLRDGRRAREDAIASLLGMMEAPAPKRRLPDPRMSLQDDRSCRTFGATQKGADRVELAVPTDDAGDHLTPGRVAHDPVIALRHRSAKALS
jgi:hypothetical protein